MSATDCNSSIASSTTSASGSINKPPKKRLSGLHKFKTLMRRGKSSGSEEFSGSIINNNEWDSPQDLPTVMDVNVSMDSHILEEPSSSYCPHRTELPAKSPPNFSVEHFINNEMDVAPYSPRYSPSSVSPPLSSASKSPQEWMAMQFSSACGPSPAKLKLLDLSLDGSDDDGVYEEDDGGGLDTSGMDSDGGEIDGDNIESETAKDPMSWRNRNESVDSKESKDDTIDGWKNVGTSSGDLDNDSNSGVDMKSEKHPSDGFLDEYPIILDGGDTKCVRFVDVGGTKPSDGTGSTPVEQQTVADTTSPTPNSDRTTNTPSMPSNKTTFTPAKQQSAADMTSPTPTPISDTKETSPPTTVSATDCMTQFSSVTGPSPVKLKSPHSRDYFNFDMSMETSMESGEVDRSNEECDDDNRNIWNGNGMDIAVDEAGEDSTVNESCTDTDAAADASTCRSDLMSPLTVDGALPQEVPQPNLASMRSLRQARNRRNNLPTTTSMLHLEYNVDHSCSTPLERLARDIGNVFRQWNVHNGCDRHVPLNWVEQMETTLDEASDPEETTNHDDVQELDKSLDTEKIEKAIEGEIAVESNQIMSMDLCMNRFANRSRKINEWMGEDTIQVPGGVDVQSPAAEAKPPTEKPKAEKVESQSQRESKEPLKSKRPHGAQCLRSKKIMFETIGFTPSQNLDVSMDDSEPSMIWTRRRYSIPLLLSLWDAPSISADNQTEDDLFCGVPLALRPDLSYSSHALLGELGVLSSCGTKRLFYDPSSSTSGQSVAFGTSTPPLDTGFGRDMSSLFNIGQHITLSLDFDSAQYSSRYNQENKHLQDIQSLYNDVHAYLTDTMEQALEQKALAVQERQRRLRRQRKRAMRMLDFNSTKRSNESLTKGSANDDIVAVGSQSMSIDIEGEDGDEEVMFFDPSDKENSKTDRYNINMHDDNEDSSSDGETLMMSLEDDLHLNQTEIHAEVMSILTSIFQNALNLAASENDCCIPVFGLWGSYRGSSRDKRNTETIVFGEAECAASSWIPSGLLSGTQHSKTSSWEGNEAHIKKLLLSSPSLTGQCHQGSFRSFHRVYSIARQALPVHLSTLHGLSCVLLEQCPPEACASKVMVTSARHCYHMDVLKENKSEQRWRIASFNESNGRSSSATEVYRETCRRQALFLLERASSPWIYKSVPMWGPSEGSPLQSLSASVSWGVVSINDASHEGPDSLLSPTKAPATVALLQLPLKIRSSNFVPTASELLDMEYSLQSAAFDPLGMGVESKDGDIHFGPREPIFFASAQFNSNLPCATMSANVRCVLAALLRCGSLGPDALPGHLTRKKILKKLGGPIDVSIDEDPNEIIGTMAESESMLRAGLKHVGPVTTRLVEAMEWAEVGTLSTNADVDRGISDALQRIGAGGLYPAPPEEIFSNNNVQYQHPSTSTTNHAISQSKGSPPGRLLSILFAHMARLRTPPSMMSLWLAFVEELRSRWDRNESLPNLGFVPGLDEELLDAQHGHTFPLNGRDCRVLGHRAHLAAFVNSSEPDPDRSQCIINQKLQVFNICIETKMSLEALEAAHNEDSESMEVDGSASNSDSDEFFDPEEEEVSFESSSREANSKEIEAMLKMEAAAVANSGHNRIGARCPVPDGLPLVETGGQVYAPYLQRTMPMTDEEEEKQNKLFGKGSESNERISIRNRIEVSQRLQTPKLMSDMSAFKAANPGCIFEDFVAWYGNPQNPLSEDVSGETVRRAREDRCRLSPEAAKVLALEEASEAIAILMSLRTFWEDSFEEAEPCPASEQHPLFDPYSTVEMILHSFETIHPSVLMGQALAVNMKSAEFVLETAARPVKLVPSIGHSLRRVKKAVNDAVEMLTKDASEGCLHSSSLRPEEYPLVHVSVLTIQKCEEACNAIGEIELLLSRALALWQLCPDTDLVDSLLQCQDGSFVFLKSPKERSAFLNAIKHHQSTHFGITSDNHFPEAAMREYIIRNDDLSAPCQLNARLVSDMKGGTSALLALTKSSRD